MCLEAGQPCDTSDNAVGSTAPRSIARYLEGYIASLEGESVGIRNSSTSPTENTSEFITKGPRRGNVYLHPDSTVAGAVMYATTPSYIGLAANLQIPKCALSPTQPPTARNELDLFEMQENSFMPATRRSPTLPLTAIPLGVAKFLLETYTKRIIPQYPIYLTTDIIQSFNAVYCRTVANRTVPTEPSYRDTYIVSLIMAISVSTAARNKQAHAQSLATGLFETAVQHATKMWTNDLAGFQALLLLMQYVFLNPSVANLTILTGFACEACIDMGLHQELPVDCEADAQERELRRQVFWCAWEMEIAVAACVRRPPKITNEMISVALPSEHSDLAMTQITVDIADHSPTFMAHRIWLYRKLESEIMQVLYRRDTQTEDPLSLGPWIARMEKRVGAWQQEINLAAACCKDESRTSLWDELKLYGKIGYHYVLVCLFGPCPKLPIRSRPDLLKAFAAAVCVASGYHDQANSEGGHIKYVFHSCYHTFSSAMIFLQALQLCKDNIFGSHTFTDIDNSLDCFATLFSTMAERWPAVSRCSQEFEQLLRPIKDDYTNFIFERASNPSYDTPVQNGWRTIVDDTGKEPPNEDFYDVPFDWNVEFGFGIDTALPE